MIKKLAIKNFKSIKDVELDCERINLLIGEPNTGKSNLLEALGVLSWLGYGSSGLGLKDSVRYQTMSNFFYDGNLDEPVRIEITNQHKIEINIKFKDDFFQLIQVESVQQARKEKTLCSFNYFKENSYPEQNTALQFIKFYRFKSQEEFKDFHSSFLLPPHGSNLFSVVMAHPNLRKIMSSFFKNFGFNVVLKPQEKRFEIQKQVEDIVISYPYSLASDTLQRIIFHVIAIESNKNSTLVFEEPEAHAFPYYTKYLGERIAFDKTNQYFIATHNPYLLRAIIEKAPTEDVRVFVCYFEDYETKVKPLKRNQLSDLIEHDPFFNLNYFLEEEDD